MASAPYLTFDRQITINDLPVGRSVEETIRLVKAFQFTVSTPVRCFARLEGLFEPSKNLRSGESVSIRAGCQKCVSVIRRHTAAAWAMARRSGPSPDIDAFAIGPVEIGLALPGVGLEVLDMSESQPDASGRVGPWANASSAMS